jgi:hypothetical protein
MNGLRLATTKSIEFRTKMRYGIRKPTMQSQQKLMKP